MNMKRLAAKLLEQGYLTLADLALDLDRAGVKYQDLFGFTKTDVEVLEKIEEELEKELAV